MKNFKYIALSLFAGAAITSCSTSKTLVSNGEYDDMYGTSSDAPVAYAPTVSKSSEAYSPEYLTDYNDSYDRMPADTSIEGTDTYFDENYVSANSLNRAYTPDAGYTSGYAEGYAEGWSDYAWSGSRNLGRWNSFNSPFGGYGYNSFGFNSFGFSPFNSGFGSYLGMGSMAYGGFYGLNSFGYSPWGMNSFAYGYSPWGYSSYGMYSPYGMYGSPYYGVQPVLANDARFGGNRSYGPRSSSGRASSIYNDGFVNTRKPVTTASSVRRSTGTSTTGSSSAIASRANGRTYTSASTRPTSYDVYTRSSARSVSSSTRSASNSGLSRTSTSPRSSASTYSRTATRARSYSPSSSNTSRSNSGYSRSSSPTRTNSTYSRPATSTRSSSSAGSYSRGSSSSSSSSSRSSSSARPR